MYGSLFENYIILEIYKKELANNTHAKFYYFRTSNQEEIDLIIDRKSNKELIEIKATKSFKLKMVSSIEKFIKPNDKGYLLFQGKEFHYKPQIKIYNYKDYSSFKQNED